MLRFLVTNTASRIYKHLTMKNLYLLERFIAFLYIILTETYFPVDTWEDLVIFWKVFIIFIIVKCRNEVSHVVDMIYRIDYRLLNIG